MRTILAILAAKSALKLNRITGSGGTALPGLVAQKLDKNILAKLTVNNFPRASLWLRVLMVRPPLLDWLQISWKKRVLAMSITVPDLIWKEA